MEQSLQYVPNFFNFDFIELAVSRPALYLIFIVYFFLYAIVSAILFYHWANYGMKSPGIMVARSLFVFVSIVLFVICGISIYLF